MSAAGKGVASKPDTAFFKQRRACWDKKIQFKYGKSDALSWERKAGDEKYDPSPAAPIDYEKHYRQLQTERAHNKQLRLKNSASTLRLGDHANDYWHSNHELFSGRVTGGAIRQAAGGERAQKARVANADARRRPHYALDVWNLVDCASSRTRGTLAPKVQPAATMRCFQSKGTGDGT